MPGQLSVCAPSGSLPTSHCVPGTRAAPSVRDSMSRASFADWKGSVNGCARRCFRWGSRAHRVPSTAPPPPPHSPPPPPLIWGDGHRFLSDPNGPPTAFYAPAIAPQPLFHPPVTAFTGTRAAPWPPPRPLPLNRIPSGPAGLWRSTCSSAQTIAKRCGRSADRELPPQLGPRGAEAVRLRQPCKAGSPARRLLGTAVAPPPSLFK